MFHGVLEVVVWSTGRSYDWISYFYITVFTVIKHTASPQLSELESYDNPNPPSLLFWCTTLNCTRPSKLPYSIPLRTCSCHLHIHLGGSPSSSFLPLCTLFLNPFIIHCDLFLCHSGFLKPGDVQTQSSRVAFWPGFVSCTKVFYFLVDWKSRLDWGLWGLDTPALNHTDWLCWVSWGVITHLKQWRDLLWQLITDQLVADPPFSQIEAPVLSPITSNPCSQKQDHRAKLRECCSAKVTL